MPNKRVNLTAGSSVALDAASSVAAAGYPWRYAKAGKMKNIIIFLVVNCAIFLSASFPYAQEKRKTPYHFRLLN